MHPSKLVSAFMTCAFPLSMVAANGASAQPTSQTGAAKVVRLPIEGKSYLFNYDGFIVRDTFFSATEMKFEIVEAPAPLKGLTGQHPYQAREVRPGVVLVSWQEHDGGTVVKLIDLTNKIAYSNYTDAKLGFHPRSGTLQEEN